LNHLHGTVAEPRTNRPRASLTGVTYAGCHRAGGLGTSHTSRITRN